MGACARSGPTHLSGVTHSSSFCGECLKNYKPISSSSYPCHKTYHYYMLMPFTYIHALSPFISAKYYNLGHWSSTGSCKYCTEKNTENKFRTQQTTVARWEKVLMLFATPGKRPTAYLSRGAKFPPTYSRTPTGDKVALYGKIVGWIPRAL